MKNLLSIILSFLGIILFAQVQDYPYLVIKNTGDESLTATIDESKEIFKEKEYQVFTALQNQLPSSIQLNPCTALNVEVLKKTDNISIKFYDCNETNVASWTGSSLTDFYHWLPFQSANIPNYRNQETKTVSIVKTVSGKDKFEMYRTNNHQPTEQELNTIQAQSEVYSTTNGETILKTDLSGGEFLLSYPKTNEIYARFYPSSQSGIYHVKILQKVGPSYYSIGFVKANQIIVEAQSGASKWDIHVFNKQN